MIFFDSLKVAFKPEYLFCWVWVVIAPPAVWVLGFPWLALAVFFASLGFALGSGTIAFICDQSLLPRVVWKVLLADFWLARGWFGVMLVVAAYFTPIRLEVLCWGFGTLAGVLYHRMFIRVPDSEW
jgi:hypothetical protein